MSTDHGWPDYDKSKQCKYLDKTCPCVDGDMCHYEGPNPMRPGWDAYFLMICRTVSARADCRRAQHGCVIVKEHRIVSTGYNGSPSGGPSCLAGDCPRGLLSSDECKSLSADYSNCISLHAEQNALSYASWRDTRGGVLYITGKQCDMCRKLSQAAGIVRVVWPDGEEIF